MTLFAKVYTDILGDPKLMRAARKGATHLVITPWLIVAAKEADDGGRISVNGEAADAIDIASRIPGVTARQVSACMRALEEIGVLERDADGVARFVAWDWRAGGKPSDTADAVRARVAKHRARKRGGNADGNAEDVTRGNALEKEKELEQGKELEQKERERAADEIESAARATFGDLFTEVDRFLGTRKGHQRAEWLRSMLKVIGPGSQYTAEDVAGACADAMIADPPVTGAHAIRAFAEKRRQERTKPLEAPVTRSMPVLSASDAASNRYVTKILEMIQQGPTTGVGVAEFIPKRDVFELGPAVAAAYDAVGGAPVFIAAKNAPEKKLHFLRRDFASAFAEEIKAKPATAAGGGS